MVDSPPVPPPLQWPPVAPPVRQRRRWVIFASLAGLVVVSLAVGAVVGARWHRTGADKAAPTPYTDQQVAEAKTNICAAFDKVRTAVRLQTYADPGGDPVMAQAMAANARLSLVGGAYYLQMRLEPATPELLATTIREYADTLLGLGENGLKGSTDEPILVGEINLKVDQLVELCR